VGSNAARLWTPGRDWRAGRGIGERPAGCRPFFHVTLIELDGDDLRREPLAVRKATLASLLRFKTKFKVESTGGRYPEDQWYV
jgi:hypothetical protein